MSRRCFPTPSSARRLSRENSFRGFLSRTQPSARFLPHPFPGSSTQKNFNSAPEKSQMTACFFFAFSRSLARISYFKETTDCIARAIRLRTNFIGTCLPQDYFIRENLQFSSAKIKIYFDLKEIIMSARKSGEKKSTRTREIRKRIL